MAVSNAGYNAGCAVTCKPPLARTAVGAATDATKTVKPSNMTARPKRRSIIVLPMGTPSMYALRRGAILAQHGPEPSVVPHAPVVPTPRGRLNVLDAPVV